MSARILLIANHRKPRIVEALETFRPWLRQRAQVVAELDSWDDAPLKTNGDELAIVLGGDGTMLQQARRIVAHGLRLVGINFGKLGFLAPFTLEEVQRKWDAIVAGKLPISHRVLLEADVQADPESDARLKLLAMNDIVITSGPPYRMVQLELIISREGVSREKGTHFSGDGVIVATPTGSTAYNLSATGPVVTPDVDGLLVTPICPQTLSFRPIVLNGSDTIILKLHGANPGTAVVVDGQVPTALATGAVLNLRAHAKRLQLVTNPDVSFWATLSKKMRWAASPRIVDA